MDLNTDWVITTELDISAYKNMLIESTEHIKSSVLAKSTSGDLSSQYDIYHKYKEQPFQTLKEYVASHIKNALVAHNLILPSNNLNLLSSWIVVGKDYGYHTLHKHNNKMMHVSSVIYLEVPAEQPTRNEGDLDGYFYYVAAKGSEIDYQVIKPEIYKMIIFPVWMWHGTYPQKKGTRISLNMDFGVK
jgi:hypothetical protein